MPLINWETSCRMLDYSQVSLNNIFAYTLCSLSNVFYESQYNNSDIIFIVNTSVIIFYNL